MGGYISGATGTGLDSEGTHTLPNAKAIRWLPTVISFHRPTVARVVLVFLAAEKQVRDVRCVCFSPYVCLIWTRGGETSVSEATAREVNKEEPSETGISRALLLRQHVSVQACSKGLVRQHLVRKQSLVQRLEHKHVQKVYHPFSHEPDVWALGSWFGPFAFKGNISRTSGSMLLGGRGRGWGMATNNILFVYR